VQKEEHHHNLERATMLFGKTSNCQSTTTTETQHKMKSGLLLDVIIRQGTPILQLLPSKYKPLLIWRNTLLVLDLGLHIIDGARALHLKRDGLSS
jgi:hypothetical protein